MGLPLDAITYAVALLWRGVHDYEHRMFPHAINGFANTHIALDDAVAADDAVLTARLHEMATMAAEGRPTSGPVVPASLRGFATFLRGDLVATIAAIEPVIVQHERISAGRLDAARRILGQRRPEPHRVPVAGVSALH